MGTPPSSAPVLALRGMRKAYPGVVALDGIDLTLHAGEVHVLLGENGAGKSTLMKTISGAVRRDGGEVWLDGRRVEITSPRHAQELGIAIIYQELNLVPHLTAAENIHLGREPVVGAGVIDRRALQRAAQDRLDELGVAIDASATVSRLGIAERQMVEVAKALSLDARVLILDEPTSALTEKEIAELFAAIHRLKARGVALVYISHRMEEVFAIGDRVTVLRDGRNVGTVPIAEATLGGLVQLMVGRALQDTFPARRGAVGPEALRVEGLTRGESFRDVSFCLRRGEVLGLAGLMGSGRTALARVIFGADRADQGALFVNGAERRFASPREAIAQGMGFLTEDRKAQGLVLAHTVQDNICLPSSRRLSRFGVMRPAAEASTATQRITELRIKTPSGRQRVGNLSGGNQQKVVLAKWLTTEASILIFDEPTRGIDVGAKVEIYQLMRDLAAAGAAILMISSDLLEVLGMSDRILVMHAGRVVAEFAGAEATQEKVLAAALGHT